jgi:hypothetical protein
MDIVTLTVALIALVACIAGIAGTLAGLALSDALVASVALALTVAGTVERIPSVRVRPTHVPAKRRQVVAFGFVPSARFPRAALSPERLAPPPAALASLPARVGEGFAAPLASLPALPARIGAPLPASVGEANEAPAAPLALLPMSVGEESTPLLAGEGGESGPYPSRRFDTVPYGVAGTIALTGHVGSEPSSEPSVRPLRAIAVTGETAPEKQARESGIRLAVRRPMADRSLASLARQASRAEVSRASLNARTDAWGRAWTVSISGEALRALREGVQRAA